MKRKLITLAIVLLIWITGNLIHLLWIQGRYHCWNRKVVRNESGLLEHSEPFSCGKGDKALIFIHGFADLPYGWKRIAQRLTNSHEFSCHAIRVPRWGESLSSARGVSIDEIRTAVDSKINEIKGDRKQIWLVGHSMGCAIAIDAIPRNHANISGLVTLAPLLRVSNRRVPCLTARFWYGLGTKVLWMARTFESPFTERLTAVDDPSYTYAVDKFVPYSVYDILFSITASNQNIELPNKMPIFCAISTRDKVIDSDAAQEWFEKLPNPKALYVDKDSEHALHFGINWKDITDEIGEFVVNNTAL
ncbi:MAG: alpha/beta hydrolase [Kiritimatiellae bacterium]|nr:alpha/beta hydrolase [Kiritimatiellia bacterium]